MPTEKLDTLVHYVCYRCEDPSRLGATKLNKVLWYADTRAFVSLGSSITGATYIKRQFGPVPKEILSARARLVESGAIIERTMPHRGYQQTQFIAMCSPVISMFSAEQISIVDEALEHVSRDHSAVSISLETHDRVWKAAEIGEEIPYHAVFAANIGEIDEGDMAWAKEEIKKLEVNVITA